MNLARPALDHGFRLVRHERLGSTNDEALRAARAGDPGRLWIVADEQTAGRGRHGRIWSSPPGNLYASLLLVDPAPPARAAELGFVAGVALARSLRALIGDDARLRIKWPNDILFDGAKLSGMLLESTRLPDGRFACVIGIGVNCTSHPPQAVYKTTDLRDVGTLLGTREAVFERLSGELSHWLDIWAAGAGFETIRLQWLSLAAGLGTWISVSSPTHAHEGTFRTIDASGRLVLDGRDGPVLIEAGDVFLRPTPKGALAALEGSL